MASGTHSVIELHPDELVDELRIGDDEVVELARWIDNELNRARGARTELEFSWEANLRMYEGIAERRRRSVPIENASNLEVTLGAIASDAVSAQMLNAIFNIDPVLTVRAVAESGEFTEHVKVLQRFSDVLARKIKLRAGSENAILDDVKLGTGILYIPWTERLKKTQVTQVVERGPLVRGVPVEDFFVPGGAYDDLQRERWCGMRYFLTEHELRVRARDQGWDISMAKESPNVDRVRQIRERLGRHDGFGHRRGGEHQRDGGRNYEVHDIYCLFDIDGDGIDEDLLVNWDQGSRSLMNVRYNPYDRRPFEVMRYQNRGYLFYGLGVIEMLRPFQEMASNFFNHWGDNALLANARFWVGKHGAIPDNRLRIWPNRYVPVANPESDIKAVAMADTYPSMPQALQATIQFAERRVGVGELSGQRPNSILGTRTPGITALTALQKSNERFGPAFDSARFAIAAAVRQAIFRYQERLLAQDESTITDVMDMMGIERGRLLIDLLTDRRFDDSISVELTASTAQVNREADRQNWILLNQAVMSIGERQFQLAMALDNPQIGPVAKDVARQLAEVSRELLERVYRTFDNVRDPAALLVDIEASIAQAEQQQDPQGLQQLGELLSGAIDQQQAAQNGGFAGAGAPVDETAGFSPGAFGGF